LCPARDAIVARAKRVLAKAGTQRARRQCAGTALRAFARPTQFAAPGTRELPAIRAKFSQTPRAGEGRPFLADRIAAPGAHSELVSGFRGWQAAGVRALPEPEHFPVQRSAAENAISARNREQRRWRRGWLSRPLPSRAVARKKRQEQPEGGAIWHSRIREEKDSNKPFFALCLLRWLGQPTKASPRSLRSALRLRAEVPGRISRVAPDQSTKR